MHRCCPVGARYSVTSCELRVLMGSAHRADLAAQPSQAAPRQLARRLEWRRLSPRAMRAMPIVVVGVIGQEGSQLRHPKNECWLLCRCHPARFTIRSRSCRAACMFSPARIASGAKLASWSCWRCRPSRPLGVAARRARSTAGRCATSTRTGASARSRPVAADYQERAFGVGSMSKQGSSDRADRIQRWE